MFVYSLSGTLDEREADLDGLWQAGASGIEERAGVVRAYFAQPAELALGGAWTEEAERDWQAEWKKDLRPVVAGRFTITPSWLRGEVEPGQYPLIIEPGMAFGTGHHATTRLAVEAISQLDLKGATVLDVGAGSGVLALAAALSGAREVLGIDIDPVTLPAAYENAELNGLTRQGEVCSTPSGTLRFAEGSLDPDELDAGANEEAPYTALLANLYAELHDLLAPAYKAVLRPGSPVILTGILQEKLPLARAALEREGFSHVQERVEGEWVLLTARAPAP